MICLLLLLTGCMQKPVTLLMNRHMNREQARASCGGQAEICTTLANTEVQSYESEFITSFVADSACHGVQLTVGSEEANGSDPRTDWRFDLVRLEHTNESEDPVFHWTLFKGDPFAKDGRMYEGNYADLKHGTPRQAAEWMCNVVKGVGGTVR